MKSHKPGKKVFTLIMAALLSLSCGVVFAAPPAPLTPEMAAKREMVRKQQEQRIIPEKRKAVAEALKAERIKLYNAKQAAETANPVTIESK